MNVITHMSEKSGDEAAKAALATLKAWAAKASKAEIEALDPAVSGLMGPGAAGHARWLPDR